MDKQTAGQESAGHSEVDNKQLSEALGHGHPLKIMLDTVIENRLGTSLSVCEVGASESKAFSHVVPLVALNPMMQLKYTATDKTEDLLSEVKASAEENHVEVCVWDLTKTAPNSLSKCDLLIACGLGLTPELSAVLVNIKSALKPQGFLLLHDLTSGTELVSSSMSAVLEKEKFTVVSVKKTSVGSSLVLCRLVHENPEKTPTIVDVDESFEWVGRLQSLLNTNEKSRIWLRSCVPQPSGLVGMTNCMRQEQGNDKLNEVNCF